MCSLFLRREVLENINKYIDQTMLKPSKSFEEYVKFIEESEKYGFRCLVVPSVMVREVAGISRIMVAGVAGFPYGYHPLSSKLKEIDEIAEGGGKEVDVVINIINVKSGRMDLVRNELQSLVSHAHQLGLGIKVIIETSELTDDEVKAVAREVMISGADFIKTNTGYGSRGVTLRDILIIRSVVGDKLRIKASGGVRDAVKASALISAGASVIGTSSGIKIVEDARKILGWLR